MRSSAFSNSVGRPGSSARPGTNSSPFDNTPPSLIVHFDEQFFKDRFRINAVQKDALARMAEAIKASPMAKDEYEQYINNFKVGTMRSTGTADDDGRAAIRMHHFSKYIQYVAKYEELNSNSPLRAKLPPTVCPALRKNIFALTDSERSRFLVALSEFKKSPKWRWVVGLATGSFTADEAAAGANKQLRDTIHQANTVLVEKAQLHFKEFCQNREQPADFGEHGFVRPVSDVCAGTYCNDSSFALWNRCLVAEFETVLRSFDPEPSNNEPLALPYWGWEEWINPPRQTEPNIYVNEEGEEVVEEIPPQRTNFGGLPTAFTAPFVEVTVLGRTSLIPNPLLDGARRAPAKKGSNEKTARNTVFVDAFLEAQKTLTDQYFQNILRNGDFASATASVALPVAKAVTAPGQPLRPNGPTVVTAPAATTANFEAVTNYIQNLVGGEHATTVVYNPPAAAGQPAPEPVTIFSATTGDLATYERAAWDPLFWLIRANTDRLFCSWQRIHFRSSDAAAAIPKTVNVNGSTRLFPFARMEDLEKQRVWDMCPNESNAQTNGREMHIKKHTATMENWWSVVSLERYYTYDEYLELQYPGDLAQSDPRLKFLLVQAPTQQQTIAGDHNNTELEVTIGNLPHSGQLFAAYQSPSGLRQLGSVPVLAAAEGTSVVARFDVLNLLTGPTENPKRSMPPRDLNSEPFWIQDRLVLELRTSNRTTLLNINEHKIQAVFDFARFV